LFFDQLYSIKLKQDGVEQVYGIPSKRGRFEVRTFYNVLIPHDSTPFPWRYIWRSKAHLRVTFLAWSTTLGKILTLDNLRKRHIIVVDWYCLCKKSGETIDHLLLHCELASGLWNSIFGFVQPSLGDASLSENSLHLLEREVW
jgi:hypothetical protein